MSESMRVVDWLREQSAVQHHQAADYIEKLEAEVARLRHALEVYLMAGHKEARREASIIAKAALNPETK